MVANRLPDDEPHRPRGGRPSALTPDVSAAVLAAVAAGNPVKFAAEAAGVGERTLYTWLRRGRSEAPADGPYRQFRQGFKKARARSVMARLGRITAAAERGGNWQADAWVLERLFPGHFGRDRRQIKELERQVRHLSDQVAAMTGGKSCPRD